MRARFLDIAELLGNFELQGEGLRKRKPLGIRVRRYDRIGQELYVTHTGHSVAVLHVLVKSAQTTVCQVIETALERLEVLR